MEVDFLSKRWRCSFDDVEISSNYYEMQEVESWILHPNHNSCEIKDNGSLKVVEHLHIITALIQLLKIV